VADDVAIRRLAPGDEPIIAAAFAMIGWHKPEPQYVRYLEEQRRGEREVWLAEVGGAFAGYVTLVWRPKYPPLLEAGVPEIQDLNVLPSFGRRGIATSLVDRAEAEAATRVDEVGIGVGLRPGYNAAQRMYVLRGYVPDAKGVTYENVPVAEGQTVRFDDKLALNFTKRLRER
jgi:GNAT superfamily N-acetyltransferase